MMRYYPDMPQTFEEAAWRIAKLESLNRALWSLIADAYAFRDEKNFAQFILDTMEEVGGCALDARAYDRLVEMADRG